MTTQNFAAAINCMDGRVQLPVIQFIRDKTGVKFVDMITEPGVDGKLAENNETTVIDSVDRRIRISIGAHGSNLIAVVGHYDCAGNPVDEGTHIEQIKAATAWLKSWYEGKTIVGLWVDQNWQVRQVE